MKSYVGLFHISKFDPSQVSSPPSSPLSSALWMHLQLRCWLKRTLLTKCPADAVTIVTGLRRIVHMVNTVGHNRQWFNTLPIRPSQESPLPSGAGLISRLSKFVELTLCYKCQTFVVDIGGTSATVK